MATPLSIPRPPTPRPTSVCYPPLTPKSYQPPGSPTLISPIRIHPHSSFSPSYPPYSPTWATINIISPGIASHYSFQSNHDANECFGSPRLTLQTSDLLGFGWHKRQSSEDNTPSSVCTPISPSASDQPELGSEGDLHSPPLRLLTGGLTGGFPKHSRPETKALLTHFSSSTSDEDEFQSTMPKSHESFVPISPPSSMRLGDDLLAHTFLPKNQEGIRAHHHSELYSPISPPASLQQAVDSIPYARSAWPMPDHSETLHTPISCADSDEEVTFYTDNLNPRIYTHHPSDQFTPISASPSIQKGWEEMVYDIITPAERFFIPTFSSLPNPIAGIDVAADMILPMSSPEKSEMEDTELCNSISEQEPTPFPDPHPYEIPLPPSPLLQPQSSSLSLSLSSQPSIDLPTGPTYRKRSSSTPSLGSFHPSLLLTTLPSSVFVDSRTICNTESLNVTIQTEPVEAISDTPPTTILERVISEHGVEPNHSSKNNMSVLLEEHI